ncbi:MAG: aminotransferase class V-fold PLP-dependent enzyme [Kiloniellales bacterium]
MSGSRQDGSNRVKRPIYLDYQATTPLDPQVLEIMMPYFTERFGNPHSVDHFYGHEAEGAVETARGEVAEAIGADSREVIFTSGATESNNLAIKGAARFRRDERDHVVTVATEHKCVLESCRRLEREGFDVTVLPVEPSGLIDLERLAEAVTERTGVVSVMAANNEIGVLQPLAEIAEIAHAKGALLHSDAAQAVGKVPLDVAALGIDLLSISGHKLYGPKGIGALFIRRRPRVRLEPLIDGGGQERGHRSGTLPAPLCVGLGAACALAASELESESTRLARLRDRLLAALERRTGAVLLNGDRDRRLPGNLNLAFEGTEAEALIRALPELAVSTGSACTSAEVEPSYVLRALGLSDARAHASLRIAIGRMTTEAEVDTAAELLAAAVAEQRAKPARAVV